MRGLRLGELLTADLEAGHDTGLPRSRHRIELVQAGRGDGLPPTAFGVVAVAARMPFGFTRQKVNVQSRPASAVRNVMPGYLRPAGTPISQLLICPTSRPAAGSGGGLCQLGNSRHSHAQPGDEHRSRHQQTMRVHLHPNQPVCRAYRLFSPL